MADEKLTIPIGVPVDTNAAAAADDVEDLRTQIEGSLGDIKAMSASFKMLRGSTDEVKAAKTQLTAKIDALKNSVSGATLALVKQGTSYDAVAQRAKKFAAEQKKLADTAKADGIAKAKDRTAALSAAIGQAGGPVAALKGKLDALKSVLGETGGSGGMGLLTLGAAGAIAAVAALVVAVVAAGVKLAHFILVSGDAARSANLMREAWSGTAKNASNLGTQIDALADKVPTSKAALNELAVKLMAMRIPGQATVDSFHAIAQASAALGDQGGAKLQGFIDRAKLFSQTGKGFRLSQADFADGALGNLEFGGVASALAKNLGIGIKEAKERLRVGAVSVAQGSKALADAAEGAFGDINLRKMMSLEVISQKLSEKWAAMTDGVNLEPLLKPLSELGKLFDSSTVTGVALKKLMSSFGNALVSSLVAAIPIAKAMFQGLVLGALNVGIAVLRVRKQLREAFGDTQITTNINAVSLSFDVAKVSLTGFATAIGLVGKGLAGVLVVVGLVKSVGKTISGAFTGIDWAATGKAIPDGILQGIKSGASSLLDGITGLADSVKKAFTGTRGIDSHSPSKAFAKSGKHIPEGVEVGIKDGAPKAQAAAADMVSASGAAASGGGAGAGGGSGGRGGSPISITINAGAAEQGAPSVTSESFLKQLTKAVEDALIGAGIPVLS